MKTEEGEDREHDDDKADKIDYTVHVHVLRSLPTSTNLRCSVSESIYLSRNEELRQARTQSTVSCPVPRGQEPSAGCLLYCNVCLFGGPASAYRRPGRTLPCRPSTVHPPTAPRWFDTFDEAIDEGIGYVLIHTGRSWDRQKRVKSAHVFNGREPLLWVHGVARNKEGHDVLHAGIVGHVVQAGSKYAATSFRSDVCDHICARLPPA